MLIIYWGSRMKNKVNKKDDNFIFRIKILLWTKQEHLTQVIVLPFLEEKLLYLSIIQWIQEIHLLMIHLKPLFQKSIHHNMSF